MSEWKETTLREAVLKANTGADAIQKAPIVNYDSGIRCLRIQDISNSHDFNEWGFCEISQDNYKRFYLKKGDILIARTGNTIGVNIYIQQDLKAVFNNGLIRLNINQERFIPKYIYYLFQTYKFKGHINSIAYGTSTQPNMQIESLLSFNFNYPPLNVQEKIVNLFSTLDRKIDNLRRQNETLEKIAQTLFKHWFIDFEFPNDDGKPYKSSGGAMVTSELGNIPEGWRVGKLGEEVETVGGGTPSTTEPSYWENGDIYWYSPTDLTKSKSIFSLDTAKKITKLGLDKSSAKLFPKYSVLMSSRATIGEITINTNDACTNQGFITLIPNNLFDTFYLFSWLKTQLKKVNLLASGSTFPELSKSDFRNFDFLVPSKDIVLNFRELAKPIYHKIENNTKQIQTLTKTRDTLLPKLMNGEIRVKEAEIIGEKS